jgi:HicA-like toxin of HicAB toxin-antitoxin system
MEDVGGKGKGRFRLDFRISIPCRPLTAMRGMTTGFRWKEMLKVREVIAMLESDDWHLVATRGSHRPYKHPRKPGLER